MKSKSQSIYRYQPEQFLVDYSMIKILLVNAFLQVTIFFAVYIAPISGEIQFLILWPSVVIVTILIAHSIANQSGATFKQFMGPIPQNAYSMDILISIAIVIALGVGGVGLQIFIESNLHMATIVSKMRMVNIEDFVPLQTKNPLVPYIMGVVLIPIYEEIFFRGLLLGSLRKKYRDWTAILISAVIFAAAHYNKLYINTFILGVVFALIVIRFGSIYYSIIAHGVWNLFARYSENQYGLFSAVEIDRITELNYWLPEIVLLIVGIVASYWFFFHYRPNTIQSDNFNTE